MVNPERFRLSQYGMFSRDTVCDSVYAYVRACSVCALAIYVEPQAGEKKKKKKYFYNYYPYPPIIASGLPTVRDTQSETVSVRVIDEVIRANLNVFIQQWCLYKKEKSMRAFGFYVKCFSGC